MIRYECDPEHLRAAVANHDKTWLKRAAKRTEALLKSGAYSGNAGIWSDIKPVFMALQHSKCIFCERQLESAEFGTIEHDVEHFRPKSSVNSWPIPGRHRYRYDFDTGGAAATGYYWLAFDLSNYAASCKVCNSVLKSNFFPIAGPRCAKPGDLGAEKQYLCYPIGDNDSDPESLITFTATTAIPAARAGHQSRRGRIIIDFFELNRESLHRERARMLLLLASPLDSIDAGTATAVHRRLVTTLLSPRMPHTSCMRSYKQLWDQDRAMARHIRARCMDYISSAAGSPPPAADKPAPRRNPPRKG